MSRSSPRAVSVCRLADRVPLQVLCCVYAFLDLGAHAALCRTAPHFRHAARLPQASCHDVKLNDWHSAVTRASPIFLELTRVPPILLAQKPRVVRLLRGVSLAFMAKVEDWLAGVSQLHTLQLVSMWDQDLQGLAKISSLRHLLLRTANASSIVTALHGCGTRLRTLNLCHADDVDFMKEVTFALTPPPEAAPLSPPASEADEVALSVVAPKSRPTLWQVEKGSISSQLKKCTALESLGLHAHYSFWRGILDLLRSARLPALCTLSISQESTRVQDGDLAGLSSLAALSSLCFLVTGPMARRLECKWPSLPYLRTLDLGSCDVNPDFAAIDRAFPLLARLRLMCGHPERLGVFTRLTDLTVINISWSSGVEWFNFAERIAVLLPLLPSLERLGVQCHLSDRGAPRRPWVMPRVTQLTLCIAPHNSPPIRAPALLSLRTDTITAVRLAAIAVESPLLERVQRSGPPFTEDELAYVRAATPLRVQVAAIAALDLASAFCEATFAVADNWL